jgi:hypothetical protein
MTIGRARSKGRANTAFGETIVRLRAAAGFPSAYSFYHRNGGRRVFPFGFAHARRVERGLALPKAGGLDAFLTALRLPPSSEDERNFLKAYLRALVGDDPFFEARIAALFSHPGGGEVGEEAVHRLVAAHAFHPSVEQCRLIYGSRETFWTFQCLLHSRAPRAASEIATATGLSSIDVLRAAAALVKARLIRPAAGDRYVCSHSDSVCVSPSVFPGASEAARRVGSFLRHVEGQGAKLFDRYSLLRLTLADEAEVTRLLARAMERTAAFSTIEELPDTGMVDVRFTAVRLFRF